MSMYDFLHCYNNTMKNSLETIFNDQISKFKELKQKFDSVSQQKDAFDYDRELWEIENKKNLAIQELNNAKYFTPSIIESTMSAILQEFNKDRAQLDDRIFNYDLQLDNIRNQQAILRQDPDYQKAMEAHNKLARAKRESEKIKKMLEDVTSQYEQAEIDFENAKLALEKAKARKEKLESNTNELRDWQEEVLNHEANMNNIYTETIKEALSLDWIKKYVSKGIKLCEKEWIDINNPDDKEDVVKKIKKAIYRRSSISLKWGKIEDINENIIEIEHESIPTILDDSIIFSVYCCCDEIWWDIEIRISCDEKKVDKAESNKSDIKDTKKENETRVVKQWKENNETKESKEIENEVFGIIKSIDINWCKSKHLLAIVQAWIEKWTHNEPIVRNSLSHIVGIYQLYWNQPIVVKTIFDMPICSEKIHIFLEKAHERAKKLDNPYGAFQNAKKYLKTGSYKKNEYISNSLLLYSISPYELGINDIPKTPFIQWWICNWK